MKEKSPMSLPVNRRVGGLEETGEAPLSFKRVNRRVGGLEESREQERGQDKVNRRVGGLEV